jgi:cell division protease FtsH
MSLQPITPTEGLRPPDQGPPEVVRATRPKMRIYDRLKWLILLTALWFVLVWVATANDPILPFTDAMRLQVYDTWGIVIEVLIGLEILRQIHFLVSERWAWYNHLWVNTIFGGTERMSHRRMSPWVRFRLFRAIKWTLFIVVVLFIIGQIMGVNPAIAAVQLPALIWQSLPMIIQIVLIIALGILQFAAIFWFMSRGGVDTYYPEDIKTRFADVWGQDQVLERVKESIVFLERPSEIEDKGGYVPGGILLWGPPGTGKTLMAEAVAGETGKPYVFVDPGAFNNMFFGVGILKVKALFRKLRRLALRYGGVIVFFDEADSLGSRGALAQRGAFPRGFSAMSTSDGCHGMAYLSPEAAWQVLRHQYAASAPDAVRTWKTMPVVNGGMGGGGGMGTLQSLLTEMSGLKKPRGFFNRHVRRALGMRPKPPPKYRIMVMMATNLPEALDEALLRPGRIDRIYKVGYPSKAGRTRTYEGYFNKVRHQLTPDEIDNLATMTPYATGATIKDLVNEALIMAIRDGREVISFKDVLRAKQLKELGPPEDVEYIQRDRHAVAVHEACHAVIAYRTRKHFTIDIATIEKGSDSLGMVKAIKVEDQFVRWRTEYEADIYVALASLAGERMFFEEDNSSGVSGDLESATLVATQMEGYWGMGSTISSAAAAGRMDTGTPGGGLPVGGAKDAVQLVRGRLADRVEDNLARLLEQTKQMLAARRREVLCLAHALETFKTLSGDDVAAVLDGEVGPLIDGRPYTSDALYEEIEAYHRAAVIAHMNHTSVSVPLPALPSREPVVVAPVTPEWVWAGPRNPDNGSVPQPGLPNGSGAYPQPQVPAPPTPILPPAPPAPPGSIAPQSPAIPPGPAMPAPTDTPYGTFPEGPQVWGPPPKDEPRSE